MQGIEHWIDTRTVAESVTLPVKLPGMFTVIVIAGKLAPTASESDRVQVRVARVHVHPLPAMPIAVRAAGRVSTSSAAPELPTCPTLVTVIR